VIVKNALKTPEKSGGQDLIFISYGMIVKMYNNFQQNYRYRSLPDDKL